MIRALGFVDLSVFTAAYIRTFKPKLKDDDLGFQSVLLRGADSDAAVLKEWPSAQKLLLRIRNEAAPHFGGRQAVLGKVFVMSLKPGTFTPWRHDDDAYTQSHVRLFCSMVPSPGVRLFSGGMAGNPPVGEMTLVDQQALHSEINTGMNAAALLVVDVRRPDED